MGLSQQRFGDIERRLQAGRLSKRGTWGLEVTKHKNSTSSEKCPILKLPKGVRALWRAQKALAKAHEHTGLKFTLDGRLVGDIAEVMALERFSLLRPKRRTNGVDATTHDGKTVQVKATGKPRSGPAFTPGEGTAKYLLFFIIDFEASTAEVAYNGLERPVRARLPVEWNGTKRVRLKQIRALAAKVKPEQKLPLAGAVGRPRIA
jgi:hypothetical protein